jgi:hypothetical protein
MMLRMTVFAIMGLSNLEKLAAEIARVYPADFLRISTTHWFVVDKLTSKEVAEKLGIPDGQTADAVVVATSGYWGRAQNQVWEWLSSRWAT